MKKYYLRQLLGIGFILLYATRLCAQAPLPDTTWVQTFTYAMPNPLGGYGGGEQYKGSFNFPDGSQPFQKVLMYYSLKCDAATNQDQYPCGEWDYLSYTQLIDSTGMYDSTRFVQPSYTTAGNPASITYSTDAVYNTYQQWQYALQVSSTTNLNEATVGVGSAMSNAPLGGGYQRTQYIFTAAELQAAGLMAGNITALRLLLIQGNNTLSDLRIKLKHTTQANYDTNAQALDNATEVYYLNTGLGGSGWQTLYFTQPFAWNGTDNVAVEFSYNCQTDGIPIATATSPSLTAQGTQSAGTNHYLEFGNGDYIEVPAQGFANVSDEITVMFWSKGNPDELPTQTYAFEAVDSQNRRVLNVHHPWSDGTIYWDAGNDGTQSYDRIQKNANGLYAGSWHHWAFVKNATTGVMQIYLDGQLWHSGSGKMRSMAGITKFRIARGHNETWMYYYGMMDEFAVFNKALDAATIATWSNKRISTAHPNYSNLLCYYPFDDTDNLTTATDASPNGYHAQMMGYPAHRSTQPDELHLDPTTLNERPNVVFEQATYVATLDSSLVTWQEVQTPTSVVLYQNPAPNAIIEPNIPNHPSIPTDTLSVWLGTHSYTYTNGILTDSTATPATTTLVRTDGAYFSPVVQFELGRFITPYGIQLQLGNAQNGFTWIYDVSDYAPLLRGTKYLKSGNAQELHNLRFAFIHGTPPRDILGIRNLWNGEFGYAAIQNNTACTPINMQLPSEVRGVRLKMRTTGHGMESYENCAEFCYKSHQIKIDGITRFSQLHKRECSFNPVYPQGGTWVYDRANWCPGDMVPTFDVELTPFITANTPFAVDYAISNTAQPQGNWVIQTQLVTYGAPNFTNDVALDAIVSPSDDQYYSRRNPVCDGAVVRIKNTGSANLTSCVVYYGVEDGLGFGTFPACYEWQGNLAFGETAEVSLPQFNWANYDPANPQFFAEVMMPNQLNDEYTGNNRAHTHFAPPPQYDSGMIFNFKGNGRSLYQNSYTLKDMYGNIVQERATINNNATYNDVFTLDAGCYVLEFLDEEEANGSGNNGLSWWAATGEGNGFAKLKSPTGSTYLTFDPDFGGSIYHQFLIGYELNNMPYTPDLACVPVGIDSPTSVANTAAVSVYPSPTNQHTFLELNFEQPQNALIQLYDLSGKLLHTQAANAVQRQKIPITLPDVAGLYYLRITTPQQSYVRSVVKTK